MAATGAQTVRSVYSLNQGSGSPHSELQKHFDAIDGEIAAHRKEVNFDWKARLWERYRNGDQWASNDEPHFLANMLGSLIERKVGALMQSKPDIRVSSYDTRLAKVSEVYTRCCRSILDRVQLDMILERGGDLGATYGFCGLNTAWDPTAAYGRGDIVLPVLHPKEVAIDPHVMDTSAANTATYMRITTRMPLHVIRARWGAIGAEVKPDATLSTYYQSRGSGSLGARVVDSFKRPLRQWFGSTSPYPWSFVNEYWFVSTQQQPVSREAAFPAGRVAHRATGVILDDDSNPYWDGGWPIDIWDWRLNAESYMGRSDIEDGRKLQESFIRLGHNIIKNMLLGGHMSIVGDWNAMTNEDWKKLEARAVRVLRKSPGRQLEFVPPSEFPPQYLEMLQLLVKMMEAIIGVPETAAALRSGMGRQQGAMIEGLQLAAETLVKSAARRLEAVLERVGQKLISRITQFYTSDRVMSMVGDDGEVIDYSFKRSDLVDADGVQIDKLPMEKRREFFSNFTFKITPLSSLPMNRVQRALMAKELYAVGIVDDEEVLKQAEYPNWRHVLERTKEKRKMGLMPVPPGGAGGGRSRTNVRGDMLRQGKS